MFLNEMQDLDLDSNFGDFVIKGDILRIENEEVLKNLVQERVKTSFGDFRLNIEHGADIDRFIGVSITNDLIEDMRISLVSSLTYDGLLASQDIEVLPLRIGLNRVYFRIIVKNPYGSKQDITLGTLYNNEVMNND